MSQTVSTVNFLKKYSGGVPSDVLEAAAYVEACDKLEVVSQVATHGKYERSYIFVQCFSSLNLSRVLVDGDRLLVCTWKDLVEIDLAEDRVKRVINFAGSYDMYAIYKFKGGFFIHGEMTNRFLDGDLQLLWEAGAADIFVNPDDSRGLEIFADHITVWDFLDYKHYYNEHGEYKVEHLPSAKKS